MGLIVYPFLEGKEEPGQGVGWMNSELSKVRCGGERVGLMR